MALAITLREYLDQEGVRYEVDDQRRIVDVRRRRQWQHWLLGIPVTRGRRAVEAPKFLDHVAH